MYRVAPFNLLLKFSQSKIVYTLKENNLVKTRLDLNTNFNAFNYAYLYIVWQNVLIKFEKSKVEAWKWKHLYIY